jgi:hypothetical protein
VSGRQAHVPWQQFIDAIDVTIRDSAKYHAQIQFRVDPIQLDRTELAILRALGAIATMSMWPLPDACPVGLAVVVVGGTAVAGRCGVKEKC